jgi:hypothetical protein
MRCTPCGLVAVRKTRPNGGARRAPCSRVYHSWRRCRDQLCPGACGPAYKDAQDDSLGGLHEVAFERPDGRGTPGSHARLAEDVLDVVARRELRLRGIQRGDLGRDIGEATVNGSNELGNVWHAPRVGGPRLHVSLLSRSPSTKTPRRRPTLPTAGDHELGIALFIAECGAPGAGFTSGLVPR